MSRPRTAWNACIAGVVLLCGLCFSPLVIPPGQSGPRWMGLPRTLWAGLGLYGALVGITLLATRVHPHARDEDPEGPTS